MKTSAIVMSQMVQDIEITAGRPQPGGGRNRSSSEGKTHHGSYGVGGINRERPQVVHADEVFVRDL